MKSIKRFFLFLFIIALPISTAAENIFVCPDAFPDFIDDICWECTFPIMMGNHALEEADYVETDNNPGNDPSNSVGCYCMDDGIPNLGINLSWWQPYRVIEIIREPLCMATLWGTKIDSPPDTAANMANDNIGDSVATGWTFGGSNTSEEDNTAFYNVHIYSFPLNEMIEMLITPACSTDGYLSIDVLDLSEFTAPTWNDEVLALFLTPEALFFSNPLVQVACTGDCILTGNGFGQTAMSWCSGCCGSVYPFTGFTNAKSSPPRVSALLLHRFMAFKHRLGKEFRTIGSDASCGAVFAPFLEKEQYKISMLFPMPEANSSGIVYNGEAGINTCCHPLGRSTFLWGEHRTIPAVGEDYTYMLWRRMDCCVR